ncbi:MAG: type 2 isopentenyl-diphosphate Delta-isomerase [Kiritimatiellae bacterium]|nr:type 2 isopentenyl-diphosphate Delta-isomerase [Kiritimatiellia bacterium]
MTDPTNSRKLQHVDIVTADRYADRDKGYFDEIWLRHRALPEMDLDDVDPSVTFLGKRLSFPLLISSMTGGQDTRLREINRNLAEAAEATGVAMGVGSQRVMFTRPESRNSFALRQHAPTALLFANLGAIQLNYGFTVETCREAVEVVGADGLYLHLNPLQEAIQPEGETRFAGLADRIGEVARSLEKPVIVKEVGAGLSAEDVRLLISRGVRHIDVAGAGGTSWSRIEHHRRPAGDEDDSGLTFQDWGIPTPYALHALKPFARDITLIGSGGIRTGVDMIKAVILGAALCGVALPFLNPAMESAARVIERVNQLKREFATAMFLLGVREVKQVFANESFLLRWDRHPDWK